MGSAYHNQGLFLIYIRDFYTQNPPNILQLHVSVQPECEESRPLKGRRERCVRGSLSEKTPRDTGLRLRDVGEGSGCLGPNPEAASPPGPQGGTYSTLSGNCPPFTAPTTTPRRRPSSNYQFISFCSNSPYLQNRYINWLQQSEMKRMKTNHNPSI